MFIELHTQTNIMWKSYQSFSITTDGDCIPSTSITSALVNGEFKDSNKPIIVFSGDIVSLRVEGNGEWWSFIIWGNGIEGFEYIFMAVDDINISAKYVNHCGASNLHTFYIKIDNIKSHLVINEYIHIYGKSSHVVKTCENILIKVVAAATSRSNFIWNDSSSGNNYNLKNIQTTTSIDVKSIAHQLIKRIWTIINTTLHKFGLLSNLKTKMEAYDIISNATKKTLFWEAMDCLIQ